MIQQISSDRCRPISYLGGETKSNSRIGGIAPSHVKPQFSSPALKYFATVEVDSSNSISIFYSLDPSGNDGSRDMIDHNNQILFSSELIHAVFHPTLGENRKSRDIIQSGIDEEPIFLKVAREEEDDVEKTVNSHTKLGGHPFADNSAILGPVFDELADRGFWQLLQFDTPNPLSFPELRDFPWDPGWLHVFLRGDDPEFCEFAFVVQQ